MARAVNRLTARRVETEKTPGYYCDGGGLYLQVQRAIGPADGERDAVRSWVFRYVSPTALVSDPGSKRLGRGKIRDMGLGRAGKGGVSLATARDLAQAARDAVARGVDPLQEREQAAAEGRAKAAEAAAAVMTFRQAAARYIEIHSVAWKNPKHRQQWPNSLRDHAYPTFGDLPVTAVTSTHIQTALAPIWATKHDTARKVLQRVGLVFDMLISGSNGRWTAPNPARTMTGLLPKISAKASRQHFKALGYKEAPAFMAELRLQPGDAAEALQLLILTGTRTSETIAARVGEINLSEKLWIIPGARTKTKAELRIPLCDAALAILRPRIEGRKPDDFLFPGRKRGKPMSTGAMAMLLDRMGYGKRSTVHGFRSVLRDWISEETNFPNIVGEMALGHAVADKVEAAYRRGDLLQKRRQLSQAWERYLSQPRKEGGGEVVPIRAGA